MAQDTLEEKLLKWPAAKRVELAEKLMASVEDFATPEIKSAWHAEIEERVKEIREGRAVGIPAAELMAEARRKLHATRRLPPVGRRRTH